MSAEDNVTLCAQTFRSRNETMATTFFVETFGPILCFCLFYSRLLIWVRNVSNRLSYFLTEKRPFARIPFACHPQPDKPRSSSGLGRSPLKAKTRVRVSYGALKGFCRQWQRLFCFSCWLCQCWPTHPHTIVPLANVHKANLTLAN